MAKPNTSRCGWRSQRDGTLCRTTSLVVLYKFGNARGTCTRHRQDAADADWLTRDLDDQRARA